MQKSTFAAGCFWGVEHEFKQLNGVIAIQVGYMGGTKINPTYEEVCTGETGHAEVVTIEYDSDKISYDELLNHFWNIHNPTYLNRQGHDVGTQYRSVIFYYAAEQKKIAEKSKYKLEKSNTFDRAIVTSIEPAQKFFKAEEYHQNYFEKNPNAACNLK